MAAKLDDVIQRLREEGQLTRNSGTNSIKSLKELTLDVNSTLKVQTDVLRDILAQSTEAAADAARNARLQFETPTTAPTTTQTDSTSAQSGGGGGMRLRGGLALGAGIAAVGVGLAGFIGAITGVGSLGFTGENLPTQAKNIALAMNEFANMDNRAIAIMGGLLASGVLLSKFSGVVGLVKAPVGMAAVGLGLGGFMAGLAAASEGMEYLDLDLSSFQQQSANFVAGFNEFGSLSEESIKMLGILLGSGALVGAVSMKVAGKAAVGMALAGLGIGGFMAGVAAAGDTSGFTGENFKTQVTNMVGGLKELETLSEGSLTALALIAGSSTLVASGSVQIAGKAALGMGLAGLGIGGFMAGVAAAGDISGFDGSKFAEQAGFLADGLKSLEGLNDSTKIALVALAGTFTAATAVNPALGAFGAAGMGLAGFGLGAFITGFYAAFEGANYLGIDGTGFKTIMGNTVAGINEVTSINVPGDNFAGLKTGLINIAQGLTGFATEQLKANLAGAGSAILAFLGLGDTGKDPLKQITDSLEDVDTQQLADAGTALQNVANALQTMSNINVSNIGSDFSAMAKNLIGVVPLLGVLYRGGTIGSGYFDGLPETTVPDGGLQKMLESGDLDGLRDASNLVSQILSGMNMSQGIGPNRTGVTLGAVPSAMVMDPAQAAAIRSYLASTGGGGGDSVAVNAKGGDSYNNAPTYNYYMNRDMPALSFGKNVLQTHQAGAK